MPEKFSRIVEVIREAPVEVETRANSLSMASFLRDNYQGEYADVRLDELPEDVAREALIETNKARMRGLLAPTILMEYPNGEAFTSPELQKLFELLDSLVEASYDVSIIINQGNLRTSELDVDEKIKLNQVSKIMAELFDLIECDTEAALNIKVLFVESMLQNFDMHKYRNHCLRGSLERSEGAYIRTEANIIEQLQYYLDVWMRGAVDIEMAMQKATKETPFVKSVEAATPAEDVNDGVDFWLRMDWDKLEKQGKIPTLLLKNAADKLVLSGKMAIQVKSQRRRSDEAGSYKPLASAYVRSETIDAGSPYIKYCRSEKPGTPGHYKLTVDVETSPLAYLKKEILYQNKRIVISQLDFNRAIAEMAHNGDLDKIPEMIFNKHATFRKQYETRN
jgi:hypothetical protein